MSIHDVQVHMLDGTPTTLREWEGKTLLIVNVASKCGLTPQYEGLQELHDRFAGRGFTVLGFPCNQFAEQEPGTADEIQSFCSLNYGVTFPLFEKIEVNGDGRHDLYQRLTIHPDEEGKDGDIAWNFEKFLISPTGEVVRRFRPLTEPTSDELVSAVEELLGTEAGSLRQRDEARDRS